MSQLELETKMKDLRELMAMQEELETEIVSLQDQLKMVMIARQADHLTAGAYKVTWKSVTSSRLDTAAIKKALPEIAERFSKVSTVRRFVVA